jgi:acyl-CoA thioester hydrolase
MAIVYHANYIVWFDMARTEFLRSLGYTYRKLESEGVWLPVVETGCRYISPARYDDEIVVETFIEELKKVKIRFGYRVKRNEELLAEGFTILGFTDSSLKPIALNKVKPDVYQILNNCLD